MPVIVTIVVFFALAALGIVVYFKATTKGIEAEIQAPLQETTLQDKQADVAVQQHKMQKQIHSKLDKLKEK